MSDEARGVSPGIAASTGGSSFGEMEELDELHEYTDDDDGDDDDGDDDDGDDEGAQTGKKQLGNSQSPLASRLRNRRPSALRMILDDREQRKIQRSRLLTRTPSSSRSTRTLSLFFADSPLSAGAMPRPQLPHLASV